MSTASPDTCADVVGVPTHRAAFFSEPYFATASLRSRCWYSGERQPLLTKSSIPSTDASVAARRRAPRRVGSSLATPGISSSKTVVPAGATPSASPGPARCSRVASGRDAAGAGGDEDELEDGADGNSKPRAGAIATRTTSRPATRIPGIQPAVVRVRAL